jgi:hypothetical protein
MEQGVVPHPSSRGASFENTLPIGRLPYQKKRQNFQKIIVNFGWIGLK